MLRRPLLPGILALLGAARALALPRGLAFNSPHAWCDAHLTHLGVLDCFSFLACGGDTPLPKPESDLDKLVLNRRGLRGHGAIAFEDSSTGSIAAKRAFSHTVVCPGPSTAHHDVSYADLRVASVADIWPWTCSCSLAAT